MGEYVQFDASFLEGPLKTIFLLAITILFALVKELADNSMYPEDKSEIILKDVDPVFDFIIVGAGTAGCVLANRLAQEQDWSVLLLEAGENPTASNEVPYFFPAFLRTDQDWQFPVNPNKKLCLSMKSCIISRGKVLGGTTTINNLQYSRAISSDFDTWKFDNWKSNTFQKIFDNLEQQELPLLQSENNSPIKALLEAGYKSINYRRIPRYNFVGFTEEFLNIRGGQRLNYAKIFLTPIKDFNNFVLSTKAFVYELEINNPADKKIVHVHADIKGFLKTIRARKEIILTTGAINTAKLLLTSGIGPKSYLETLKAPIIADLPVGKKLKIRISVPIFIGLMVPKSLDKTDHVQSLYNYLKNRTGYFNDTGINDFVCYLNTKNRPYPLPAISTYHYYFQNNELLFHNYLESLGYEAPISNSLLQQFQTQSLLVIEVTLIKPDSFGEVLLNGTNYKNKPTINANFLSDGSNSDHDNLMNAIGQIISMLKAQEFRKVEAQFLKLNIPNCRNFKFETEHYLSCYIKNMGHPNFDVSGTTVMGTKCDQFSVVNEFLEVNKVRGLRVVDSGVLPDILTTGLEGTISAIAERAADFIKEKWIKDYTSKYPILVDNSCEENN